MKLYLYLFAIAFLPLSTFSQFIDSFTDGDFTVNPAWSGEVTEFQVNTSSQLQLDNSGLADTSYLSATNNLTNLDSVEWQFYVKQNFSPSGNNYGRVYLVSDQSDLSGALNGYYLLFGEAGSSDAISLYEQSGTSHTLVCNGTAGAIASSFEIGVKVLRNHLGDWEVYVDYTGGTTYTLDASGNDQTHNSSAFIGVFCQYTSSNSTGFYFDEFYSGAYMLDLTPPSLISASALNANQIDVVFDEGLDQISAENINNYFINNGIGNPSNAQRDGIDPSLVHLTLATGLTNGQLYTITVNNVSDLAGNPVINSTEDFTFFQVSAPAYKDVQIVEIFADPSPQVALPTEEFIEIYNVSTNYFNLNGWQLSDGTFTATLNTYILGPGEYLILCTNTDTALYSSYGPVMGLSSFPSLNNSGDDIELTDGTSQIDLVKYRDSWYQDGVKEDGGYTLELINPTIPCSDPNNWIGSFDPSGGTPGAQNSVADFAQDTISPYVVEAYAYSLDSISILFSEGLDPAALSSLSILFSNGLGYTESVDGDDPAHLWLTVTPDMVSGDQFTIDLAGLTDCSGNIMSATQLSIFVPKEAWPGDIVINEVLFDPRTGGTDFVELYNRSGKAISLKEYQLANYDGGMIDNHTTITEDQYILYPGEYVVMSKDSSNVKMEYPFAANGVYIDMSSLPTYSNDSSTVYFLNENGQVLDRLSYDKDMHFSLLNEIDGVSLERIDPDRESDDKSNWHSAASTVGFATPGYRNSQYLSKDADLLANNVSLSPEIFSPDNDGFEDILNINYAFDASGYVATIGIYDAHGRLIRWLAQNELLNTEGTISWDGTTNDFEKALTGTYILYFEIYNISGTVEKFKKPCVVAAKL